MRAPRRRGLARGQPGTGGAVPAHRRAPLGECPRRARPQPTGSGCTETGPGARRWWRRCVTARRRWSSPRPGRWAAGEDPRNTAALGTALQHADPGVRRAAAEALGDIGGSSRAAAAALARQKDPDAGVRAAVASALGSLADPRGRARTHGAGHGRRSRGAQRRAHRAGVASTMSARLDVARAALGDAVPEVRLAALRVLASMEDPRVLARALLGAGGWRAGDPGRGGARSRPTRGAPGGPRPLARGRRTRCPRSGWRWWRRSGSWSWEGALHPRCSRPRGTQSVAVRTAAAEALRGYPRDEATAPRLAALMKDERPHGAPGRGRVAGASRVGRGAGALRAALGDSDIEVRRAAARGLGRN